MESARNQAGTRRFFNCMFNPRIWHGHKAWNAVAILARGEKPQGTRRGLRGDPDDTHSPYIEAVVAGVTVGCLYLPNGNPAPGPKFDYKLKWFDRLHAHAAELLARGGPVVLAGDFNVIPTEQMTHSDPQSSGGSIIRERPQTSPSSQSRSFREFLAHPIERGCLGR